MADTIATEARYAPAQEPLIWRRLLVVLLCAASWVSLGVLAGHALGGAWFSLQTVVLVLFLLALPWTLLNLWNSVIGFAILRLAGDAAVFTNPALARTPVGVALTMRTAICLAIRHEDVAPAFARLTALVESLAQTRDAPAFSFHILSDSSDPTIIAAEQSACSTMRQHVAEGSSLHYRRRSVNTGFKAGNLYDFATEAGRAYDFMLVLDADSVMSAAAVIRLAQVMQANPQLGILQTLSVGRPSSYAFTRLFQFGMRNGMRTHATGLAWWQGPDGPYWGHNAMIRVAPFAAHCQLPVIPGKGALSGHILSHDQVEAALMRRGGFDVRLLVDEFGSWEENPPDLPSFIKRDLRWCQGNLQYLKLFGRIRLAPMGVFQLVNAVMMYFGSVFWISLLLVGLAIAMIRPAGHAAPQASFAVYLFMFGFGFVPRLLGILDTMLNPLQRRRYGGAARLLAGTLAEACFGILLGTSMAIAQTIFIGGLLFGRRVIWEPQRRAGAGIGSVEAFRKLWPQTVFGLLMAGVLVVFAPDALPGAVPTLLSCLLAVPFATLTAWPPLGRFMQRCGLCAAPEEGAGPFKV